MDKALKLPPMRRNEAHRNDAHRNDAHHNAAHRNEAEGGAGLAVAPDGLAAAPAFMNTFSLFLMSATDTAGTIIEVDEKFLQGQRLCARSWSAPITG